jgi:hypothetical protein
MGDERAAREPRGGMSFLVGTCCAMTVRVMRGKEPAAKPPRSRLGGGSMPLRDGSLTVVRPIDRERSR